jgi:hypothetical protein
MWALGLAALFGSACHAQRSSPGASKDPLASVRFGGSGDSTPSAPAARTLHGFVRDGHEKAISGALVYLKDLKTAQVLSVTTDDKGEYRFVGLEQNVDYQFWAQIKDRKSEVSSFDATVQMVRSLQIN